MADLEKYAGYAARAWRTYRTVRGIKKAAEVTGAVVLGAAALGVAAGVGKAVLKARQNFDLKNKVVLITGGSRGLGLILARLIASEGARIALCARDSGELEAARQDLIERGTLPQNVFIHRCDITDPAQVTQTARAVRAHFGPIEVLINNAGIIQVGPAETQTDADYEEAMQTNFWGAYHFVQAVLPDMRARRAGRIVNVSSIGGLVSIPHMLPYSTAKHALVGFSEGLRAELVRDGIQVTTVCPGTIRTGSPTNAFFKGQHKKEYEWFTLGDSLPGASQSADATAKQIVRAMKAGEAFLVTSAAAQALSLAHNLLPGATATAMGLVNRLLPDADGPESVGTGRRKGSESETPLTQGPLTALTQKAVRDNNQQAASRSQSVSEPVIAG